MIFYRTLMLFGIKNNTYICKVIHLYMPEIFRCFGYSFFFYSREHEPIHVHVEGNDGYAVYDLIKNNFVLREQNNIKSNDQRKIEAVIADNKDIIIKRWKEHFDR